MIKPDTALYENVDLDFVDQNGLRSLPNTDKVHDELIYETVTIAVESLKNNAIKSEKILHKSL